MSKLPNFFIVGAPKAGTTSLYFYLKRHPDVFMSPVKEPNFFSYDETIKQNLYHKEKGIRTFEAYQNLFAEANGHHKAIGEASVSYLFYPSVPDKIKEKVSDAKIIISLRNPIDRCYSHYFMEHKLGYVSESLENIVFKKSKHKFTHLYYQQFVELGMYYQQVKRYIDTFGRENVRIYIYEDLDKSVHSMATDLFNFLKVKDLHLDELNNKYNTFSTPRNPIFRFIYAQKRLRTFARQLVPKQSIERIKNIFLTKEKKQEVNPLTVEELKRIYKPDIIELEKLLNRNLSTWYE